MARFEQPLDNVGARGEELLAAKREPLDQVVDEEIGARVLETRGRGALDRQEVRDPLARLGRELRRLGRSVQRRDHVDLPPPRDLHAARDVGGGQLDRRARERPHDRRGVARVNEQPQPRQHVAHLGAIEEGVGADDPAGDGPLGQGHRHPLALLGERADQHRAGRGRDALAPDQPLELRRHPLCLRTLVDGAPEAHLATGPAEQVLADPRPGVGDHRVRGVEHPLGAAEAL